MNSVLAIELIPNHLILVDEDLELLAQALILFCEDIAMILESRDLLPKLCSLLHVDKVRLPQLCLLLLRKLKLIVHISHLVLPLVKEQALVSIGDICGFLLLDESGLVDHLGVKTLL